MHKFTDITLTIAIQLYIHSLIQTNYSYPVMQTFTDITPTLAIKVCIYSLI